MLPTPATRKWPYGVRVNLADMPKAAGLTHERQIEQLQLLLRRRISQLPLRSEGDKIGDGAHSKTLNR
jgi:hypothetical protein